MLIDNIESWCTNLEHDSVCSDLLMADLHISLCSLQRPDKWGGPVKSMHSTEPTLVSLFLDQGLLLSLNSYLYYLAGLEKSRINVSIFLNVWLVQPSGVHAIILPPPNKKVFSFIYNLQWTRPQFNKEGKLLRLRYLAEYLIFLLLI